jgi:hypothetical protein
VQRFGLSPVCHVCSGHGIIDEVTGQPPVSVTTVSSTKDFIFSQSPTVAPPNLGDTFTSTWTERSYQVVPPEIIAEADKEIKKMLKDLKKKSK